jgi:LysM repeat protein
MITKRFFIIFGFTVLLLAVGCTAEPQTIEVTRVVNLEVPVTVEVTRLVAEAPQEVIVEVTRIVEVPVTEPAPEPTAEAATSPTPEPTATTALASGTYIVQAGDSLYTIAENAGITIAVLRAANGMDENSPLIAGRELVIPGPNDEVVVPPTVEAPSTGTEAPVVEAAQPTAAPPAAPTGGNLLPNPSFEEGWHFYLYNELQVPDGWQLAINEGSNTIEGGSGGVFNRPEVRVISTADLPPAEHSTFILNGNKTVKAFKGAAPTAFSMFTDIALQPGSYRFAMRFVPDTVIGFDDNVKVYSPDPLDAEVRIIAGSGGTGWQGTSAGQPNTLTHEFTLDQAQTIRLGGDFRNRKIMANNGWFLDDWSLVRLE